MTTKTKHAGALAPGDQITLHGQKQTVTHTQRWNSGDIAVFTDHTGDDPWLIRPAERITIRPAKENQP